ncbi:MAG: CDGSH iron-sulfur domain-containing protein [Candidatus Methanoperedens sp.]|nr:CDGSH iron-sulfur domain-containing protein [Candidatus Methanoperedens sp.]
MVNTTNSDEWIIKVSKNGPYLVSGKIPLFEYSIQSNRLGIPMNWILEKKYPVKENYALCRCGQSKNKPFCDGTHARVQFNGKETADLKKLYTQGKEIQGPELLLKDVEKLCASARFCHRSGEIWEQIPRSDDPQIKKIAIRNSFDCPSGRLSLKDKRTGKSLEPELGPSIAMVEDLFMGVHGPIWVRGMIPIQSADGKIYDIRNRVTLCRCGRSENKPFCDSSHYPEQSLGGIIIAKGELKEIKGDLEDFLKTRTKTFVLFYASWCSFCRDFLPTYDKYFENQPEMFLRVMIDDREELMDKYSVEIVPTILLFENGMIKRRCDGEIGIGLNEKHLIDLIRSSKE